MSEQYADMPQAARTRPAPDGILGYLDILLDRLDDNLNRLDLRVEPVLGPYPPEKAMVEVESEPVNKGREQLRRFDYLLSRMSTTIERIDL